VRSFRRFFARWVLAVALCHVAVSTTAAANGLTQSLPAEGEVACTCTHGPDANCPMHKLLAAQTQGRESTPGQPHCCSRQPDGNMLLTSLIVWSGAIVPVRMAAHAQGSREHIATAAPQLVTRERAPASPPPRG
jgi:hypothetical protein